MVWPRVKVKRVYGVGINDAEYPVQRFVNGKLVFKCPFYSVWKSMLERGYSNKFKSTHPTYKDATVCEEWHRFSSFKNWMETQDWEDKALDKDILYPDNMVYSPNTCCFVPQAVNNFLTDRRRYRGAFPLGVYYHSRDNEYRAQISDLSGKQIQLGTFDSPHQAHQAWAKEKLRLAKELCVEENLIDPIAIAIISKYQKILEDSYA